MPEYRYQPGSPSAAPPVSRPRFDLDRRAFIKAGAALVGAAAVASLPPLFSVGTRTAHAAEFDLRFGRVGFVLSHEQFPVRELVDLAVAAETAGFDMVWNSDHFQPWQSNQGHSSQAWVALGAIGQRTQRIGLGTGVTCPTFRYPPAIVAEAFATLGNLYPGRVFLGIGSGEALNEQAATGEWAKWPERSARLVEATQVIRELWTGEKVSHHGQYYTVNARLFDPPQVNVPIFMAANGPKAMHRSALHSDGVITDTKMIQDVQAKAQFKAGAGAAGKDPNAVPVMVEALVVVGNEDDARQAAEYWRFQPKAWKSYVNVPDPDVINQRADAEVPLEEVYKDWPISSDPDVHVEALMKLYEAGASHIFVHSGQPDQRRVITFYGQQVLPRLRRELAV